MSESEDREWFWERAAWELPDLPKGWKWELLPDYPKGMVVGPCICGSWPGGKCLRCKPTSPPQPIKGIAQDDR